jgi:hypothetical protein
MVDTVKLRNVGIVLKSSYIDAKTKDLKEYGYTNITNEEVGEQLEKVLNGEELSVIGKFIEDDIEIIKPL